LEVGEVVASWAVRSLTINVVDLGGRGVASGPLAHRVVIEVGLG